MIYHCNEMLSNSEFSCSSYTTEQCVNAGKATTQAYLIMKESSTELCGTWFKINVFMTEFQGLLLHSLCKSFQNILITILWQFKTLDFKKHIKANIAVLLYRVKC